MPLHNSYAVDQRYSEIVPIKLQARVIGITHYQKGSLRGDVGSEKHAKNL